MKKFLLASLATAALFVQPALAQNATTVPVGAMTIDFPATGASPATTLKYFSLPLHNDAAFTGKPTAVTADTITFTDVNWTTTPSQFGANPSTHIVRILTGQQAGRILKVISNTTNSLTVSILDGTLQSTALDYSGFAVTTSDLIEIVPADTLAGIFGDGTAENPLMTGWVGTTSAFTSDTISLFERKTGLSITYYFHIPQGQTAAQGTWRKTGTATSANLTPVYSDDAILVVRRTNRPATSLVLTGRVPTVSPLIKAFPSRSYLTTLGVPVDVSLNSLTISGAWTRNSSLFTSDTIAVYNPNMRVFVPYFQRTDNSWRSSASSTAPNVSSFVIPAGSTVNILERTSNQVGASSFNKFPLPYNL